jgi:GDPmannose 4,6-dehydratase
MQKALISGGCGQDASYLSELLLGSGYEVHSFQQWESVITSERIDHLLHPVEQVHTHYGDLTDTSRIHDLISKIQPDEVYNLGSMSHVGVSFELPEYAGNVTGLAVCRILEALRQLKSDAKFYQASSSEMFGSSPPPQSEMTPFHPVSPYGCAKLYGYWITRAYRTGYEMFACNGILFNHESPRRGPTFVTQKIIREAVEIKNGKLDKIHLGNLDSKRDWGFSGDYVEAMYLIMHHDKPDDFVIATGENHTVREFAERVFDKLGLNFYDYFVSTDKYKRPNEVPELLGDPYKARTILGWEPKVGFDELIDMMLENELRKSK